MLNHRKDCQPGLCYYGSNACPMAEEPAPKEAPVSVSLNVDSTVEQLATMLCNGLSYDDQISLIAEMDARNADSEFTGRVITLASELAADLGSGLEEL